MFSCNPEHKGLISVIWPDAQVYEDTLPFFLPEGRIIFYSDCLLKIEDSRIITVRKELGNVELSTKSGFIEALKYVVGDLAPWEEKILLDLDTEEFWVYAKSRLVVPLHKNDFENTFNSSVVKLFSSLFTGFSYSFPIYSLIRVSYKSIMLSLITMMATTINPPENKFSNWYIGVLKNNSRYLEHFKKCVLNYLESKQKEQDFLSFLQEVYPYNL